MLLAFQGLPPLDRGGATTIAGAGMTGLGKMVAVLAAAVLVLAGVVWATGLGGEARALATPGGEREGAKGRDAGEARSGKEDGDGRDADDAPAASRGTCTLAGTPVPLPGAVQEASGVALGRRTASVLWTHADSGEPQVLALSTAGEVLGTVRITDAAVQDWEDVAVGPCPEGSCLFLGDIGDNDAKRARITVYRVPEPQPTAGASAPAQALHATYPDGAHDAEALFVDRAGRIHIVTKGESGPVALYRFPESPSTASPSRLERVGALTDGPVKRPDRITGADLSADGRWVGLRTLGTLTLYPAASLTAGRTDGAVRYDLSAAGEAQGEGVALGPGGTVYLVGEGVRKRDPATLTRMECPPPR